MYMHIFLILLPNTNHFQQVEDYVRVVHGNFYRFPRFVFDIGYNSIDCFNRMTHNYGLWQPIPVRYPTWEK
jgi:hypothetical protein